MEFFQQPEVLLALGLVAAVAGFVDTLAGGGGLIVVPALLLAQVPPVYALATNKFQGTLGTCMAAITMAYNRLVSLSTIRTGLIFAFAGSAVGALIIQQIPAALVAVVVPLVLAIIALYFLFFGQRDTKPARPLLKAGRFDATVVPAVGFYDGAFGVGAGPFYTMGHVALLGRDIVTATARTKMLNFASNLAALLVFMLGGKVLWLVGGVMAVGSVLGAYCGSKVVIERGHRVIRPAIVAMSLAMLGAYGWRYLSAPAA